MTPKERISIFSIAENCNLKLQSKPFSLFTPHSGTVSISDSDD
jgi:hypothetical protein